MLLNCFGLFFFSIQTQAPAIRWPKIAKKRININKVGEIAAPTKTYHLL